ncbi:hypothetical protein LIX17_25115 (plasmid) [Mycobacterium avium subsp. hominissuis]|uniref:hypothetical protein n=1 Tax=Mycobacterium avium TaxID=1764 RepID=UPI0031406FE4
MTKNSAQKKAARALQRTTPGINFNAAMAACDDRRSPSPKRAWTHGQQPWVRTTPEGAPTRCYLCGRTSSIVSFGDLPVDHGRVQMYCEHHQCDARETEVIVVDDGSPATVQRSDVRILAHFPPVTDRPQWWEPDPRRTWAAGTPPHVRSSGQRMPCLFCGDVSCTVAPATSPAIPTVSACAAATPRALSSRWRFCRCATAACTPVSGLTWRRCMRSGRLAGAAARSTDRSTSFPW